MKYIVFSSDDETIITSPEDEGKVLKLYFIEGGRELEDYDREEFETVAVTIKSRQHVYS